MARSGDIATCLGLAGASGFVLILGPIDPCVWSGVEAMVYKHPSPVCWSRLHMKTTAGQASWAWAVANWADISTAKAYSPFLDCVLGASVWSSCCLSGLPDLKKEDMVCEDTRALLPQQHGKQ